MHFITAANNIILQKDYNNKKTPFQETGFIGWNKGSNLITTLFLESSLQSNTYDISPVLETILTCLILLPACSNSTLFTNFANCRIFTEQNKPYLTHKARQLHKT